MKYLQNLTILFFAAGFVAMSMTDRAVGQCQNGMCGVNAYMPSASSKSTGPVEASVSISQKLGPAEQKIVDLEKHALEKWYSGDPTAYIAMIGDDIGYFEPILDKRLDGRTALKKMYEALRGRVHADKFDMLNTRVQMTDKMAILSFNLISIEAGVPYRWNCTEVFSPNKDGEWKLIHSHWSQTKPQR